MDDLKLYVRSQAEIESLMHTANIYFDSICMDIDVAKCNSKGFLSEAIDIGLSNRDLIVHLSPVGACKCLGILEADNFKHQQMKDMLSKEYKRHVLHSKLFSRNLFTALNIYAVSLMRYSGGIVKWSQDELRSLNVDTRKLLTMHGGFSTNSDVDRLYIPRKNGARAETDSY